MSKVKGPHGGHNKLEGGAKMTALLITLEQAQALEEGAEARGVSKSAFMREVIQIGLAKIQARLDDAEVKP